jgi:hypothetical protein
MNKKVGLGLGVLAGIGLAIPLAHAAIASPIDTIGNVFSMISQFFSLDWLIKNNQHLVGFLKFLLWITVFSIFFIGGSRVPVIGRRLAGILSAVIATITIIFTPNTVMFSLWESYTVVVLFVLIGIPVGGFLYLAYGILPGAISNRQGLAAARIFIFLLCWMLAFSVTQWGDRLLASTMVSAAKNLAPIGLLTLVRKHK